MIKIQADPEHLTVTDSEEITYRLAVDIDPPVNYLLETDKIDWGYTDLNVDRFFRVVTAGGPTFKVKFARPGQYRVFAHLQISFKDPRNPRGELLNDDLLVHYRQNVAATGSFMWDPVRKELSHVQNPISAIHGIRRYALALSAANLELQFDFSQTGQAAWQKHQRTVAVYRELAEKIEDRLASTDGWERFPLEAFVDPDASSEKLELKVFLARKRDSGIVKLWKVVDWTVPGDAAKEGEYDGKAFADSEAMAAAIDKWRSANKYPTGTLTWEAPKGITNFGATKGSFRTNGGGLIGFLEVYIAKATVVLTACALVATFLPIPGSQVVAGILWGAVFAGGLITGGISGYNIYERHDRGVEDSHSDAVDALNVAMCLLGTAGSWAKGARVLFPIGSEVRTAVLVGEVASGSIQGVLMVEATYDEVIRIRNDKTLSHDDKLQKIVIVVGQAAVNAGVHFVNVKGNVADAARKAVPKPPPVKPKRSKNPAAELLNGSPDENLKKLKNPDKLIDVTEAQEVTGDTKTGEHTTVVENEPSTVRTIKLSLHDKFDHAHFPGETHWRYPPKKEPRSIDLRHKIKQKPNDPNADMYFQARLLESDYILGSGIRTKIWIEHGTGRVITDSAEGVALVKAGKAEEVRSTNPAGEPELVAKELYTMMYDHFEATLRSEGRVLKGERGSMQDTNYESFKAGLDSGKTTEQAFWENTTARFSRAELDSRGYDYKFVEIKHTPGVALDFEIVVIPR